MEAGVSGRSASALRPHAKRDLERELELYDKRRRLNATAWFDTNARRAQLDMELNEILVEETQDLKSSIFSVMDQKETYQEEIKRFVAGEKRKGAEQAAASIRNLGTSLRALEQEIHQGEPFFEESARARSHPSISLPPILTFFRLRSAKQLKLQKEKVARGSPDSPRH